MGKQQNGMSERERVEALLHGKKPDRVSVWPFCPDGYSALKAGLTIADAYNPEKSYASQKQCASEYGWVFAPYFAYASFGAWEFGGDVKWPTGQFDQAIMIARHPVNNKEDIDKLEMPAISKAGYIPLAERFYDLAFKERMDNEPFNVMAADFPPFTFAANICGIENFMKWMIKDPETAHRLLRLSTDFLIQLIRYWKDRYGTEGVLPSAGEATATNQMISPKHFKEFAWPYNKEIYEEFVSLGYKYVFSHICGEQNMNLPMLAELPLGNPGIISIGHEIDILDAAEALPEHIIMGNIDPTIIMTATKEVVYQVALETIEKGKTCSGGFILSSGCQLGPMSPEENVKMLTKAVQDEGWY